MKHTSFLFTLVVANPLFAGDYSAKSGHDLNLNPAPASSGWHLQSVSAGASWRLAGSLDYDGRTQSENFMIPQVVGGNAENPPAIGTTGLASNRTYTNGFVNLDGTNSSDGDTWFWGYDSPAQVQGESLVFNAIGTRSVFSETRAQDGTGNGSDDLRALSPQLDFVFAAPRDSRLPIDGILVSLWTFSDDFDRRFSNFRATQTLENYRTDFLDRYDISGISPVIDAPYVGSETGPGPLISNLPDSREESETLVGTDEAIFSNSVSTSLDFRGYSLAIGPTWQGTISRDWSWQASAGMTLNLFQWKARENESLTLVATGSPDSLVQEWRRKKSGSEFSLGIYAKGEILRRFNDRWFAKGYLQAETAQTVEMEIGGSKYEFTPQGASFGFSLGYQF